MGARWRQWSFAQVACSPPLSQRRFLLSAGSVGRRPEIRDRRPIASRLRAAAAGHQIPDNQGPSAEQITRRGGRRRQPESDQNRPIESAQLHDRNSTPRSLSGRPFTAVSHLPATSGPPCNSGSACVGFSAADISSPEFPNRLPRRLPNSPPSFSPVLFIGPVPPVRSLARRHHGRTER